MSGRRYRVVERFPWIEGGTPIEIDIAPGWKWEGGKDVIYEPGDIVYIEDRDLSDIYHKLEAIDEAGRVALEEIRERAQGPFFVTSLDAEQSSFLACGLARTKMAQGEDLKKAILWAIRNGAKLPDDLEARAWIADALEGKLAPKRGRGRPNKKPRRDTWDTWDYVRGFMEAGMVQAYSRWLEDFQRDRGLAWLRFEALRIWEEHPDAPGLRRMFDLGMEEDQRAYAAALTALGAAPCPKARRGAEPARELALKATAREYKQRWKDAGGGDLTPSRVARILTRANKSE